LAVTKPGLSDIYRIALSLFEGSKHGIASLVGDLVPLGLTPQQFCLVGIPSALAPLARSVDPNSPIYPTLAHLVSDLQPVDNFKTRVPLVASAGPITEVLLKGTSWLSTPSAATLMPNSATGDLALAVNACDHDQFVHASRLLLRYGGSRVLTHIFAWPPATPQT
jgi:hypothetical protein